MYADQLADAPDGFEIAVNVTVTLADDVGQALLPVKGTLGFYIGGMGAKGRNFHTDLMARMGYEDEAHHIQDLFFEGKREEAIAAPCPTSSPTRSRSSARRSASGSGSRRGARHPSPHCSSAVGTPRC